MQETISSKIKQEAKKRADELIKKFNLLNHFSGMGFTGEEELTIQGIGTQGRGLLVTVKVSLDDLSETLKEFLELELTSRIESLLFQDFLDGPGDGVDVSQLKW